MHSLRLCDRRTSAPTSIERPWPAPASRPSLELRRNSRSLTRRRPGSTAASNFYSARRFLCSSRRRRQHASASAAPPDLLPEHRQTTRNVAQLHACVADASYARTIPGLLCSKPPTSTARSNHCFAPLNPLEHSASLSPASACLSITARPPDCRSITFLLWRSRLSSKGTVAL